MSRGLKQRTITYRAVLAKVLRTTALHITMSKFIYKSRSIYYCLYTAIVICTVMFSFFVMRYVYVFGEKDM